MKSKFLSNALPLAALLAAGVATSAQAVVVTEWSYDISSEFPAGLATFVDGSGGGGGQTIDSPLEISWGRALGDGGFVGVGGGRSSLTIGDTPELGSVFTNGAYELGNSLTHKNNVISSSHKRLDTATLSVDLELSAIDPALGDVPPFAFSFDINFFETTNDPGSGICADGTLRSDAINDGGCRDIFVIALESLDTAFAFGGEDYLLSLRGVAGSIGTLSDAACATAGAASGCSGFMTNEGLDNDVRFEFAIRHIPEPGMLGLFGLGLVGLGASRRRRKA